MPKKTKREKIIAEYRRKIQIVSDGTEISKTVQEKSPVESHTHYTPTFTISRAPLQAVRNDTISIDPNEFSAIKKDLAKTLILTCCMIIGQIAVWRILG